MLWSGLVLWWRKHRHAATAPANNITAGLRLSTDDGDERVATIQETGLKIFARSVGAPVIVTVER